MNQATRALLRLLCSLIAMGALGACAEAQGQTCFFTTSASTISLGSLDPSSATTRTAFSDVRVLCIPLAFTPSWQFTGTNGNAPLRMKHATQNAFIPYTASVAFTGNVGLSQNWRITATVLGQDYQNAFGGTYSDLLTATITP